jgi:hypothetical protein
MSSAFPRPTTQDQCFREVYHQTPWLTSLQWDCDGALNDWDREWLLQQLAAADYRCHGVADTSRCSPR